MAEPLTTFGGTLTGGIQEISALLPLIGTEQCETHIGSALEGGYIYVAATVLSIFGSLGVAKAGVAVLIASISIPKFKLSFKFRPFPGIALTPSGERILGAKMLKDSGFKLPGTVAPRIGIDPIGRPSLPFGSKPTVENQRYTTETMLLVNLEEKHVDDPERLSVTWKCRRWNIRMISTVVVSAFVSLTPYVHFFTSFLPNTLYTLSAFPLLRTVGGCLVAVAIQFIIQHRIVCIIKCRIVFMVLHQRYGDVIKEIYDTYTSDGPKEDVNLDKRNSDDIRWDENLPSEECLEGLEMYLSRGLGDTEKGEGLSKNEKDIQETLKNQREKHFGSTGYNISPSFIIAWICLFLGIPATVAGYIGCFTIVSNSREPGGPLIWLGVELVLSILRILLWAMNPKFDEDTQIMVELDLDTSQPRTIQHAADPTGHVLDLIAEQDLLERITRYTGPLDRFNSPQNVALYFTICRNSDNISLSTTVVDLGNHTAITLHHDKVYDTSVHADPRTGDMQATLQSEIAKGELRLMKQDDLIGGILKYSCFLLSSIQKRETASAKLTWRWTLSPESTKDEIPRYTPIKASALSLEWYEGIRNTFELECKWKTGLIECWGGWIAKGSEFRRQELIDDFRYDTANPTSKEALKEATDIDFQLLMEWIKRELALIKLSLDLEGILCSRIVKATEDPRDSSHSRVATWLFAELKASQRVRLNAENQRLYSRLEEGERNLTSRRYVATAAPPNGVHVSLLFDKLKEFVRKIWPENIERGGPDPTNANGLLLEVADFEKEVDEVALRAVRTESQEDHKYSPIFCPQWLKDIIGNWQCQRGFEQREMKSAVKRVGESIGGDDKVYAYPIASVGLASAIYSRFGDLDGISQDEKIFVAKLSSAAVYDLEYCDSGVVHEVVRKTTTRSIIDVDLFMVKDTPESPNLFYTGHYGMDSPFIVQRNRRRWFEQAAGQTNNAFTLYFSPCTLAIGGRYVCSTSGTIAHVMLCVKTTARLRLRLVHCRHGQISISIQEPERELHQIQSEAIPEDTLEVLDILLLPELKPRQYDLGVVVHGDGVNSYHLRDITVELVEL